jgi:hypothetical protein
VSDADDLPEPAELPELADESDADESEPDESEPDADAGSSDQPSRDLAAWASESRELLAALLSGRGIEHVWQGTTLVTPSGDDDAVQALVTEVETAATPLWDEEEPRVVYEVGGWPVGAQSTVASRLAEQNINHAWDAGGDLIVAEADEAAVEAIFDEIDLPEGDDDDDDDEVYDGPEAMEVMSQLFVAADRLRRNALDPDGVLAAVEWSEWAEAVPLPFGLSPAVWKDIVGQSVALRQAIEADDEDGDEQIHELAESLRRQLRQYV